MRNFSFPLRAVEGCRGLIAAYEGKIQKILGRVWEG
jgi:hypothetical protein